MTFEIRSGLGVGPVNFGMPSRDVGDALGATAERRKKSSTRIPPDFFRRHGILAYYDDAGLLEALEFGGPASPTFAGEHFLGRPYREVERWMRTLDPDVALDAAGLRTQKFGVGVYAPHASKAPDLPVEGVIVFKKGYFPL